MLFASLSDFLAGGAFAFMLIFVRFGTALMIMPGLGDSFVPARIRLHMAVGISLALFPMLLDNVPSPIPTTFALFHLILMEFIIGLFIGTVARIFMTALDTAGMIISIQSGIGNAQLFNPSLSTQGSLLGAFMSITGVMLLFATNLHHLMIMGLFESYELFPVGGIPDSGSMAQFISKSVSAAFIVGVQISVPFIVLTLLVYTGMGVLSRLMPQVQVFMIALPLQILLSISMLTMVLSAGMLYFLKNFEQSMIFFLSQGG